MPHNTARLLSPPPLPLLHDRLLDSWVVKGRTTIQPTRHTPPSPPPHLGDTEYKKQRTKLYTTRTRPQLDTVPFLLATKHTALSQPTTFELLCIHSRSYREVPAIPHQIKTIQHTHTSARKLGRSRTTPARPRQQKLNVPRSQPP